MGGALPGSIQRCSAPHWEALAKRDALGVDAAGEKGSRLLAGGWVAPPPQPVSQGFGGSREGLTLFGATPRIIRPSSRRAGARSMWEQGDPRGA